jgi:plasmid stabilization system protein ParE
MVETSSNGVPDQAQAAKDEAIHQASDLKDTALEHVGAVTADAKAKATDVAHDVRRELHTQGETQAKRAASALHDVGSQLSDMANAGQPGPVSDVTRQLADKSRQVASRLEEGGIDGVGDDLRRFARRQPGLFLAAAGVAGFVVTRMLRNAQSNGQSNGLPTQQPRMSTTSPPSVPMGVGMPAGQPALPETLR